MVREVKTRQRNVESQEYCHCNKALVSANRCRKHEAKTEAEELSIMIYQATTSSQDELSCKWSTCACWYTHYLKV